MGAAGTIAPGAGQAEHDLKGKALSPGFIDTHTHDDRIVLDAPDMLPKISQGVTTVVTGNCGISLAPVTFAGDPPPPMNLLGGREAYEFPTFAAYARAIAETTPGVNVAALIGHSALRLATMSDIRVKASDAEIGAMLDHVDEAMENGAAGFSTGLFYPTNAAADIDEVSRVADALRRAWRRLCHAHARREATACSIPSTRRWRPPGAQKSRSSSRTTNAPARRTGAARRRRFP